MRCVWTGIVWSNELTVKFINALDIVTFNSDSGKHRAVLGFDQGVRHVVSFMMVKNITIKALCENYNNIQAK